MKAILLSLACLASVFSVSDSEVLQPDFEGKIEYKFEYLNVPDHMRDYISQMSQGLVVHAKGPKSRMEQTGGAGPGQVVVNNYATDQSFVLMDLFGLKVALIGDTDTDASAQENRPKVDISYPGDTKKIAGFTCEKAVIRVEGVSATSEVWVTPKFKSYESRFDGLKGYPLEFTLMEQGFQLRATATSVSQTSVSDSFFTIPSEYEPMTEEAFQQFIEALGQ